MTPEAFISCVTSGEAEEVRAALALDPALATARDASGVSVVCLAVYHGQLALARDLAASRGGLDLFEAACVGDDARVEALLVADPAALSAESPDGFSALALAAFFGHPELLARLVARGADVERPSNNPMQVRPLHGAAAHADQARVTALARPLLEAGADPNAPQAGGYRPLHEAALNGNRALIELLLAHGADPSLATDTGETAAALAASKGHDEAAARLGRAIGSSTRLPRDLA